MPRDVKATQCVKWKRTLLETEPAEALLTNDCTRPGQELEKSKASPVSVPSIAPAPRMYCDAHRTPLRARGGALHGHSTVVQSGDSVCLQGHPRASAFEVRILGYPPGRCGRTFLLPCSQWPSKIRLREFQDQRPSFLGGSPPRQVRRLRLGGRELRPQQRRGDGRLSMAAKSGRTSPHHASHARAIHQACRRARGSSSRTRDPLPQVLSRPEPCRGDLRSSRSSSARLG
jgi:hypothetical protein